MNEQRVSDLDYTVATLDRDKRTQLRHINMLKPNIRSRNQKGSFSFARKEALLVMFYRLEGKVPEVLWPEPVNPTRGTEP